MEATNWGLGIIIVLNPASPRSLPLSMKEKKLDLLEDDEAGTPNTERSRV